MILGDKIEAEYHGHVGLLQSLTTWRDSRDRPAGATRLIKSGHKFCHGSCMRGSKCSQVHPTFPLYGPLTTSIFSTVAVVIGNKPHLASDGPNCRRYVSFGKRILGSSAIACRN